MLTHPSTEHIDNFPEPSCITSADETAILDLTGHPFTSADIAIDWTWGFSLYCQRGIAASILELGSNKADGH